jgi:Na+/H+-dicarboxylate symporter
LIVSVFFIGISYALKSLGTTLLLAILLLFAMLLIGVVYYFRSKKYKPGKTFTDMKRHQKTNRIYAFETNSSKAE